MAGGNRADQTGLRGSFARRVTRQSGGNANPVLVCQSVRERLGG